MPLITLHDYELNKRKGGGRLQKKVDGKAVDFFRIEPRKVEPSNDEVVLITPKVEKRGNCEDWEPERFFEDCK